MSLKLLGTLLMSLLIPAVLSAAEATLDDWNDGNLHGWMGNTTWTNVSTIPTGGNGGGYLQSQATNIALGALNYEDRYTGDYQAAHISGVAFDLNLLSGSYTYLWVRFRYQGASYNGWHYEITSPTIPAKSWGHFEVPFDPTWSDPEALAAGWVQESSSPSFSETMADVYTAEIRVGSADINLTKLGIDNFRTMVTPPVPAVGLWGKLAMFLLMLAGGASLLGRRARNKAA